MGKVPAEMRYIQNLAIAGVTMAYRDYFEMPAIAWSDWLLWKETEAERSKDK